MTTAASDLKNVHVLILAAGASRRFGADKRQVILPTGRTLLQQSLQVVAATGLPFSVVSRPGDRVTANCPSVVYVEDAADGMGSSIAGAVAQIKPDAVAVLILPVDLPLLRSDTVLRVAKRVRCDTIVRPDCKGQFGHPVGFGSDFFPDLRCLSGEQGAQSIIRNHADSVQVLVVDDPGICRDIDTPEALSALSLSLFPAEHR